MAEDSLIDMLRAPVLGMTPSLDDTADGAPAPGSSEASALLNDPILGPLLQASPELLSQMTGGSDLTEKSLPEILAGTAMAVTGRLGLTGSNFSSTLPRWVRSDPTLMGLARSNPDFDPYLGIVSEQGDERVYMGTEKIKVQETTTEAASGDFGPSAEEFRSGGVVTKTETVKKPADETMTVMQVQNMPYNWSEEEITGAMRRMREAGINVTSFSDGENSLLSVWGSLVDRAAMTYSLSEGKKKVTPWDVLDMYKSEAQVAGSYTNFENGSRTTTSKSVANITEGEAWMAMKQNLSQMLGRDPSDQEIRDFTYRMNQLAAQNPSITKTITQYKGGEAVSQSNTTEGGFAAADMAQASYEQAQDDPEYGAFQAASTYFNSALSALGAIGQV